MFFSAVCSSEIAQDRASTKQFELNSVASAALSMVEATSQISLSVSFAVDSGVVHHLFIRNLHL